MGISGAGFVVRFGVVRFGVVVRFVLVVLVRLLVLRRRRPGMPLPFVHGTVSGGTDGTSDGIAG